MLERKIVVDLQQKGYIVTKPVLANTKYLPDLLAFKNNKKYAIIYRERDDINKYLELCDNHQFKLVYCYYNFNKCVYIYTDINGLEIVL
jgi:hypothetical protein